ncbi:MAG: carbon monoxide dehydrogenase subunit [Herbaspirillum sp.]|jgi:carbon monoxide dehydrogenase subunit G|nr:carbon monoxide dehydrogenase subunit [Herbaspirillum sp.]
MEINGERIIAASRQTVWDAINDPEILKLCIPGGESVERVSDSQMKAVVRAKIGPVRARFTGAMTMADVVAPESCTLLFEGTGGPAGFAKGQATVALSSQGPDETLLRFSAAATVGGKLGQIGARLIESAARAISDEFFTNLMDRLSPKSPASEVTSAQAVSSDAPPAAAVAAQATAAAAPPVAPVAAAPALPPGYILVDTRWLWGIAGLAIGFLLGRLL